MKESSFPRQVIYAETPEHLEHARQLFEEYREWRGRDPALDTFAEEIASLPGKYAPPDGCLLLAYCAGQPQGCVALHKWSDRIAEMKRLYVRPRARGAGLGKALVEAVIEHARRAGYESIRLDSTPQMDRAQALYLAAGFYEIPPYRYNPNVGTKFFELALG